MEASRMTAVWAIMVAALAGHAVLLCAAYGGPNQYVLNHGAELSELEQQVPVVDGLAWGFYGKSCPNAESIVADRVAAAFSSDQGVAGGLLRLFFHDCFVQGCDASILLRVPSGTELDDLPNQTIRASALNLVNDIKSRLEAACPRTVSCSDIVVMAARSGVAKSGGPSFNVPLGRRDSLSFSVSTADLPAPTTTFAQQSTSFKNKGLDNTDLVALAGGHTLGVAHCGAFTNRLYPNVDPKLNSGYAGFLKKNVCPSTSSTNSSGLDFYSPNKFDNQYFKNLPTGGALLTSDQNLDQDSTAWNLVKKWSTNQDDFFNQFKWSYVKMSQIAILSGNKGEIRKVCTTTNSGKVTVNRPAPVVEPVPARPHIESGVGEFVQALTSRSRLVSDLISMVVDGKSDS